MAKVMWGGADLETALDDYEDDNAGRERYTGDRPGKGVYRWRVTLQKAVSSGGFNQIIAHFTLDPHKPSHKQFKGYYCRSYIIVKDDGSTAFRVRPLLDSIGVSAKQFRTGTVSTPSDQEGIEDIVKMGPVSLKDGVLVYAYIQPDKNKPQYEDIRPQGSAEGDDEESNDGDTDTDDDSDDEPPF